MTADAGELAQIAGELDALYRRLDIAADEIVAAMARIESLRDRTRRIAQRLEAATREPVHDEH